MYIYDWSHIYDYQCHSFTISSIDFLSVKYMFLLETLKIELIYHCYDVTDVNVFEVFKNNPYTERDFPEC